MKMRLIPAALSVFVIFFAHGTLVASPRHPSPIRMRNQDFRALHQDDPLETSAWNQQSPYSDLTFSSVFSLPSVSALVETFKKLRDIRAWQWENMPDFPRRITWLYPWDGCYLRAQLMTDKLKEWNLPTPKHLFIFGNLETQTSFEEVTWWYHVAPIYKANNEVYVLDPAINPQGPLKIQNWIKKMTSDISSISLTVCGSGTLNPGDSCDLQSPEGSGEDLKSNVQEYLGLEWNHVLTSLGRSPEELLGDRPPWALFIRIPPLSVFRVPAPVAFSDT